MLQRPLRRQRLNPYEEAAHLLRSARHLVALTGAGISTPSGIPDFRSEHFGLWQNVNPLEVASLWGFHAAPERFYAWFRPVLQKATTALPNEAHTALARLEADGRLQAIMTQNIDSLHQHAGSRRVLELHGHARTATCLECRAPSACDLLLSAILGGGAPPRCTACGGLLKPDVILFGEPLPYDVIAAAQQEALACDVMLVIGTSLEVMPAADLPLLAKRRGARLILINRTPTPLDAEMDIVIRADVVHSLRAICGAVAA